MKKSNPDIRNLLYLLSLSGSAVFFVYAFFHGSSAFDWLVMENNGDLNFIDFFMHICNVADRHTVYRSVSGQTACFPPLAYCIYYCFYKIIYRDGFVPGDMYETMHMPYGLFIFMIYSVLTMVLLYVAISCTGRRERRTDLLLFFSLFFSAPFLAGSVEKGNSVVLVVILLILALNMKESDTLWKREIALILIAICAGLKIYPAVFGILYLLERRYKEAIRLTVYGVFFFFAPFAFFGRFAGFRLWRDNISMFSQMMEYGRIQFIKGAAYTLIKDLTGYENVKLAGVISIAFLLIMLALCCITHNKYRRLFYLCSIMAFFPNYSYRYTLCYLAVPLIFCFKEYTPEGNERIPVTVAVLYGLLFSIPVIWGLITGFRLNYGTYTYIMTYVDIYLYSVSYLLLTYMIVSEVIMRLFSRPSCSRFRCSSE